METQLAQLNSETMPVRSVAQDYNIMPVFTIKDAIARRNAIVECVQGLMKDGVDYGVIPGTGGQDGRDPKKTLLKPGAEKLVSFFGLTPRYSTTTVEDWTGEKHDGEPFLYYLSKCSLWRGELLIAEGEGICHSWEKKYRWRNSERVCPECGKPAILKSKNPGEGFFCWRKRDGCGATFPPNDSAITGQETGRVPNPDVADLSNTLIKMAAKRALVAACLIGVNASEMFTQDMEEAAGIIEGEFVDDAPRTTSQRQSAPSNHRPADPVPAQHCDACRGELTDSQALYSAKKFGRALCPACQKKPADLGTAAPVDNLRRQVNDRLKSLMAEMDREAKSYWRDWLDETFHETNTNKLKTADLEALANAIEKRNAPPSSVIDTQLADSPTATQEMDDAIGGPDVDDPFADE